MAELRVPEINIVVIAGNLTKDPVFRQTINGMPVASFVVASNRRFRDGNYQWQEDVCYVGVVAWSKLAESCKESLHKGSAVLVDGELQSRVWKLPNGSSKTIIEVKAKRIQFLNKKVKIEAEHHTRLAEDHEYRETLSDDGREYDGSIDSEI